MLPRSIYIGFDAREFPAFAVAKESFRLNMNNGCSVRGVLLSDLQRQGLYTRPTTITQTLDGPLMIDELSRRDDYDGAISTEFAISRFLVPELVRRSTKLGRMRGWALFVDCDVLVRRNIDDLFNYNSELQQYAVLCVKHDHRPASNRKMDGQLQTAYPRKNWSSVTLYNCDHPANEALTPELVNSVPGADLHRFCWLEDDLIGGLSPEWNFLVGETRADVDPRIVHFTNGGPWMRGYEDVPYADEWRVCRDLLVS